MIDRLMERIEKTGNPSVVGLDPVYDMIPGIIREEMLERFGKTPKAAAEMFLTFNKGLIDSLADIVPAVKPQIAMYERYGAEGISAYAETAAYARAKGMIVIGDIKRGDIASTAEAYASHLDGTEIEGEWFDFWQEDAVTLNPYLGYDSIAPFLGACAEKDKGVFMLVKTSNPSGGEIQDLMVEKRPLYEQVAELVSRWGEQAMGMRGYSKVGAVVGATYKEQGERLRALLPHTFFLVPGYGAQGAAGGDLRGFFDAEGRGCIVNSSRGIIAAYKNSKKYGDGDYREAARDAAISMREDLAL